MKKILSVGLVLALIFQSCSKSDNAPSCNATYDPCAVQAPQEEIDSVVSYLTSHGITDTVRHCSGMFYAIDTLGVGKNPDVCSVISIKYKGYLKDSTVFDQSNSLTYVLGRFIAGFKNGLPLIKEGGTIHLYIPPSLAYGSQAVNGIPANSMLIFNVSLTTVQ